VGATALDPRGVLSTCVVRGSAAAATHEICCTTAPALQPPGTHADVDESDSRRRVADDRAQPLIGIGSDRLNAKLHRVHRRMAAWAGRTASASPVWSSTWVRALVSRSTRPRCKLPRHSARCCLLTAAAFCCWRTRLAPVKRLAHGSSRSARFFDRLGRKSAAGAVRRHRPHVLPSGYDLRGDDGIARAVDEIERSIGLERLRPDPWQRFQSRGSAVPSTGTRTSAKACWRRGVCQDARPSRAARRAVGAR